MLIERLPKNKDIEASSCGKRNCGGGEGEGGGVVVCRKAAVQKRASKVIGKNSCWGERKTRGVAVLRLCPPMCLTFCQVMRLAQSTES